MLLQMNQRVGYVERMDATDYIQILRDAMWRGGKSQDQLADHLGIDKSTLSRQLAPGKRWSVERYLKALKFLGVDPHSVFGGKNFSSNVESEGGGRETGKRKGRDHPKDPAL